MISTLQGYETVTVAKLKILVYLKSQRKEGELYFKNGGKTHDMGVITENIAHSSTQRRGITYAVLNCGNIEIYMCVCVLKERYL